MGLMFIFIYFVIIFLVLEIAVVLLRSTGLRRQISRFQVVSMMTGTGFTTKESELILRHPMRRRIGMFLIMFGAFSLAVIISSISTIMAESFHIPQLVWTVAFLAFLLAVLRFPAVNRFLVRQMHDRLQQSFDLKELPVQESFEMKAEDLFVDIPLHSASNHVGRKVRELLDESQDMNLLFIKRGQGTIRKERLDTELVSGDILYIFGSKSELEQLFKAELENKRSEEHDERKAVSMSD